MTLEPVPSPMTADSWTRTTLFALFLVALGQMLLLSDGVYGLETVRWFALGALAALLAVAAALTMRPLPAVERLGLCAPVAVLLVGLTLQFPEVLTHRVGWYLRPGASWTAFMTAVITAAVLGGSLAFGGATWARVGTALVAVCFFSAGLWVLRASPQPTVDVFYFQQMGSEALLHGHNPYALTFPNVYHNANFYGPGLTDGRTLFFGFPYPPLSLLLASLGFATTGDHRTAQLVAVLVAAASVVALRPDRLGALAAVVLLFVPRGFYVLEHGFTEPFGVALLALVLLAAARARRVLWLALGALFAWKQYTVVLFPLTVLLLPGPFSWKAWGRLIGPALLVTLVLTLPLALWNVGAFWRSVVWLQTVQPFRPDALSFPAALAEG